MAVHSNQLGHDSAVAAALVPIYTVPAGVRTIVKSIVGFNNSGSANDLQVYFIHGSTELGRIDLHLAANGSAGDSQNVQPWIVLNAGDEIEVYATQSTAVVLVSGSELTL